MCARTHCHRGCSCPGVKMNACSQLLMMRSTFDLCVQCSQLYRYCLQLKCAQSDVLLYGYSGCVTFQSCFGFCWSSLHVHTAFTWLSNLLQISPLTSQLPPRLPLLSLLASFSASFHLARFSLCVSCTQLLCLSPQILKRLFFFGRSTLISETRRS